MKGLKRWFTAQTFASLERQVSLTLDYLESVSERPDVEEKLEKDLEQMKKWTFECPYRLEVTEIYQLRLEEIKEKRQSH